MSYPTPTTRNMKHKTRHSQTQNVSKGQVQTLLLFSSEYQKLPELEKICSSNKNIVKILITMKYFTPVFVYIPLKMYILQSHTHTY